MLRKIFTFLFLDHSVGFVRFCYAMLIPCTFSPAFCRAWMLWLAFVMVLAIHGRTEGWYK